MRAVRLVHGDPVHSAALPSAQGSASTGNTSLWMFPIYGSACLLAPLKRLFEHLHISRPGRGLFYMAMIFTVEYLSGRLLWKHGLCPWDYGKSRFHIHRIIRLDYAPWWFLAGLFFEKILP